MLDNVRDFFRRFFKQGGAAKSPLHLAQRQILSVRGNRAVPSLAQWRELPRYLTTSEKRLFIGAIATIIIAIGLLGFRLLTNNQTSVPAIGGSYTEGLIGTPQFINPLYASGSDTDTDLTKLVFSGLMRLDATTAELIPDLAAAFTVSNDQKTYTFTLRDNAFWHDGDIVTASDIVFTINAIQNPDYHSPLAVSFSGVSVKAEDDHTVIFTLAEPFAPFLSTLTVGILPEHIWQDIPPGSAPLAHINLTPIGSGPYKFNKITTDQRGLLRGLTLVRNHIFYRGAPYISELNFKFYADPGTLLEALKNRNVEGAGFIPSDAGSSLQNAGLQTIKTSLLQFTALFLNDTHNATLADSNIRQALNLATDRAAIVSLTNAGTIITSPILPSMPGYDATIGATTFDLPAATALLDNAGWKTVEGSTIRAKNGTPLTFGLTTLDTPGLSAVATKLAEQWATAGIDLTVTVVSPNNLQNNVLKDRDYDILLTGELYGADQDPYAFWHSSQVAYPGLNLAQFSSRKADDAIETARATTDITIRAASFTTLAKTIADAVPAIFLYQPNFTYFTASRIQGIHLPTMTIPADRFANINEWYIKTRKTLVK